MFHSLLSNNNHFRDTKTYNFRFVPVHNSFQLRIKWFAIPTYYDIVNKITSFDAKHFEEIFSIVSFLCVSRNLTFKLNLFRTRALWTCKESHFQNKRKEENCRLFPWPLQIILLYFMWMKLLKINLLSHEISSSFIVWHLISLRLTNLAKWLEIISVFFVSCRRYRSVIEHANSFFCHREK